MDVKCSFAKVWKSVYLYVKAGYIGGPVNNCPQRTVFVNYGGVAERLKAHAWKVCKRATVS